MRDIRPLTPFSERIKWLIQRNTRFGGTGVVQRLKVEEIGATLGCRTLPPANSFSLSKAVYGTYTPVAGPLVRPHPPKRTVWSPLGGGWRSMTQPS
jgi:hypothetical protein